MSSHPELAAGVIHDIGYRRYDGPRLGRRHAVGAVYLHGLRGVCGIGRPARAKVLPFLLFAITSAPALISGALSAITPLPHIPYANYAYYLQIAIMIFLAAQAPQVVTGDIRFRTLSLYFSRPLERAEYVWAKLAALATALFALMATPLLVIYLAVLLSRTHSASDALNETGRLLAGLAGVTVHALLLAAIGMLIASFTRVRAFAVVGIIGLYLVTSSVATIIAGFARGTDLGAAFGLLSPFSLLDGFQAWALRVPAATPLEPGHLGWLYALVVVADLAVAAAVLQWRYRRIES
jgi:ABC-2 type transport system permease protein